MNNDSKQRRAYYMHKTNAQTRGIPWEFTFSSWWNVWKISQRWNKRGTKIGQFVMARNRDRGAYSPTNVKIITCSKNCSDAHLNKFRNYKGDHPDELVRKLAAALFRHTGFRFWEIAQFYRVSRQRAYQMVEETKVPGDVDYGFTLRYSEKMITVKSRRRQKPTAEFFCQALFDYCAGERGLRVRLAKEMDPPVTRAQMSRWVAGTQKVPAERALQITRLTGGYVSVAALRPDIDWSTE